MSHLHLPHLLPPPPASPNHPGRRWGTGAHSVLEQLLIDRANKPSTGWREEHPWALACLPR